MKRRISGRLFDVCLGLAMAAVTAVAIAGPALAQSVAQKTTDMTPLVDRLERLERDIRTLNIQNARGAGAAGASAAAPSGPLPDAGYARLSARLDALETDLRSLTGRFEELSFKLSQATQQFGKFSNDTEYRLTQIEGGVAPKLAAMPGQMPAQMPAQTTVPARTSAPAKASAMAPAPGGQLPTGVQSLGAITKQDMARVPSAPVAAPKPAADSPEAMLAQLSGDAPPITAVTPAGMPVMSAPKAPAPTPAPGPASVNVASNSPVAPTAPTAALPEGSPRDQYMHAFGLLRQGKYDQASAALKAFLEKNGADPLASNARYWLGETYYVRGAFVEAAETFLEGYQSGPQGPKAADALLKLGMSLSNLDKKREACAAFEKLRTDFPQAPAGLKSTLQREWQKNGCV